MTTPPEFSSASTPHCLTRPIALAACLALLALSAAAAQAAAPANVWYVTRATDLVTDGDLMTRSGSLRFVLAHVTSGDFVSFDQLNPGITTIAVYGTLVVPAGVTVGHARDQDCGRYTDPLVNLEDTSLTVNPVVMLNAGSTFRNIDIGGGDTSLTIAGSDVDVCAVALGIEYYTTPLPYYKVLPPKHGALLVDGSGAVIHRGYINGRIVVSENGSDSRIGDAIGQEGEGNGGVRAATVSVQTGPAAAAQRVTIRDPFPRGLVGMPGSGISGGDDVITHTNNWAQTPSILSAVSSDNFATVAVIGTASPNSLVDVFIDDQITIARQSPVVADAAGVFTFTGALPGPSVRVFAVSTLNDPAHPNRVGSSSEWSDARQVTLFQPQPQLSASATVTDLNGLYLGAAHPGDILRFVITMTNTGMVKVTGVNGSGLSIPSGLSILTGSGAMQGGSGFVAGDGGFSGGALSPGSVARYSLDMLVTLAAPVGVVPFSAQVDADGIAPQLVSGSIEILPDVRPGHSFVWLPAVMR